ncbi:hypothetical protein DM860_013092 [Cuscuta australis]|uniref:Uncharacterized protein n=1 Tax=Cuscuta australis TaxID=267555 RepID=A0A328D6F2_9ASTE|nr:hypothetical protein DM860_013092 [Cuscuta australis]
MLSVLPAMCNEVEDFEEADEVFFDSFECLSLEEPVLERGESGYDVWLNGLHSVNERRQKFLRRMGKSSEFKLTSDSEAEAFDERICDYSEAVCSSSSSPSSSSLSIVGGDEGVMCAGERDCRTDDSNCLVDDPSGNVSRAVKAKKGKWWKPILPKMRTSHSDVPKRPSPSRKAGKGTVLKVHAIQKGFSELTALYAGQEITGHTGMIRTMKFSHDGQYLASGGEHGVVRVWSVELVLASDFFGSGLGRSKKFSHSSVEIPEKVFQIKESPVHEFHGHTSGVLDLSWSSTTNCLLSSSKDNTVRLWKVGSDECLGVFHHNNYVTCVQFNPADENLFISGCIDGKVRVWQVTEKRVADWADVHDIVTAICYQPNGKGFISGSISGVCRFYETGVRFPYHGNELCLDGEVQLGGKRRSNKNIITGIQFISNDPQKVMITSGDSKIRILDGREVVCKYRGLAKSGSQVSAACTPTGKHVISVGEDSRVYLWDHHHKGRSFEHFVSESASIAIPWLGVGHSATTEMTHPRIFRDSEGFSLGNWFSMDISSRGCSVTWPEEVLPHPPPPQLKKKNSTLSSPAWGLVIVTAGWDGKIRTFHNYGLPVRI